MDRSARTTAVARALGTLATAALVLPALTGCVSPAIDDAGYRGKAVHSVDQMLGIVNTARLAVRLDLRGRMIESVTDTVVSDAENDAQSVLSAFETVQPPSERMVLLRSTVDTPLQDAASNISDLRIAERRNERPGERKALGELAKSVAELQKLQARL